jgi:hypothetical protein
MAVLTIASAQPVGSVSDPYRFGVMKIFIWNWSDSSKGQCRKNSDVECRRVQFSRFVLLVFYNPDSLDAAQFGRNPVLLIHIYRKRFYLKIKHNCTFQV